MDRAATDAEIRAAYRERARRVHPDRGAAGSAGEMARLNEAYRVLRDPARRAVYDRSLDGRPLDHGSAAAGRSADSAGTWSTRTVSPPSLGPARIPWRLMAVMTAVGVALVIAGAALREPPAPEVPDGVLGPGSCVEVAPDGLATEVVCGGPEDLVVVEVVPFEETCPAGSVGYLDRQGLGRACVRTP